MFLNGIDSMDEYVWI